MPDASGGQRLVRGREYGAGRGFGAVEEQAHAVAGLGLLQRGLAEPLDGADDAPLPVRAGQGLAGTQGAALRPARDAPGARRADDGLDGEAQQRRACALLADAVQGVEQGLPGVPGELVGGGGGDVVPGDGADRDGGGEAQSARLDERRHLVGDPAEVLLRVSDEVHLGDRAHHVGDAEQFEHPQVPAGLVGAADEAVDHDDAEFGPGGSGGHVLEEGEVARHVDEDVAARLGLQDGLGGVQGEQVGAFLAQPVEQEREAAVLDAGAEPVGRDRPGVVQHPAEEGGLAVVDLAHEGHVQGVGIDGAGGRPGARGGRGGEGGRRCHEGSIPVGTGQRGLTGGPGGPGLSPGHM